MIRKLLVIAAAIAMPVSIVAVSGGMANASSPHTVGTDKVTCKDLTGTLTFSPKLDKAGYKSGSITTTVSASVSGCTVTGGTAETRDRQRLPARSRVQRVPRPSPPESALVSVATVQRSAPSRSPGRRRRPCAASSLNVKSDVGGKSAKGGYSELFAHPGQDTFHRFGFVPR